MTAPAPTTAPAEWLSPAGVEAEYQISRGQLGALRFHGQGPAYSRPGGRRMIRYRRSDVEAWLEAGKVHPAPRSAS